MWDNVHKMSGTHVHAEVLSLRALLMNVVGILLATAGA